MINCKDIIQNPDWKNVKLFVTKVKPSQALLEIFYFLIENLRKDL